MRIRSIKLVIRITLLIFVAFFLSLVTVNAEQNDPSMQDAPHCAAMGMADGSAHVDPPQDIIDQVSAEYEANCQAGKCFLSKAKYQLLIDLGHTRAKIDCFLKAGEDQHN